MERRKVIGNIALGAGLLSTGSLSSCPTKPGDIKLQEDSTNSLKGNINHSVCQWCFSSTPLEELCEKSVDIGIKSIDLVGVADWPILFKYGLTSAMGNAPWMSLTNGFANPKFHADLQAKYMELIPKAAENGIKNIICFSGNRVPQISDAQGLENCARGLEPLLKVAEKEGVNLVMELLNSKVDHKGYMCDHTSWGVKLCEKIGKDNFKLLYDIYHMQIMEGDVISTIRNNHQYIAHYHTAGVPGRNEIDESQELYYPAIMRAIVDTGFKGYVAQEFIPKSKDALASLADGIEICDV